MSLVNNYLKRLGRKSIAPEGKGSGRVPPSLQRSRKTSWGNGIFKKYMGFAGLFVVVSGLGYLLTSVVPLLLYPAVDTSVAVEPQQISVAGSPAEDAAKKRLQPVNDGKNDTLALGTPVKAEREPELQNPPVSSDVVVAESTGVTPTPLSEKNDTKAAKLSQKSAAPQPEHLHAGQAVARDDQNTGLSTAIEEPRPLAETWPSNHASSNPINVQPDSRNKVFFKETNNTPDYIYQLALQAQHNNQYGRAERYYQNVLEEVPDHENALINLSAMYIQEQRIEEAQLLLQQVLDNNPENPKALVNAGMIELQNKNKQRAADYFLKALKHNPIEETALRNMAYLAQLDNRYEDAGNYFAKLIKISPDKVDILLAYAALEEKRKKYTSAITLYRQCLNKISMGKEPERYEEIMIRIQILRQYSAKLAQ